MTSIARAAADAAQARAAYQHAGSELAATLDSLLSEPPRRWLRRQPAPVAALFGQFRGRPDAADAVDRLVRFVGDVQAWGSTRAQANAAARELDQAIVDAGAAAPLSPHSRQAFRDATAGHLGEVIDEPRLRAYRHGGDEDAWGRIAVDEHAAVPTDLASSWQASAVANLEGAGTQVGPYVEVRRASMSRTQATSLQRDGGVPWVGAGSRQAADVEVGTRLLEQLRMHAQASSELDAVAPLQIGAAAETALARLTALDDRYRAIAALLPE